MSTQALLMVLRRKRLNLCAQGAGEPAVRLPSEKVLITRGKPEEGGGMIFLPADELIKAVEQFLK